jgi:hypothetical protein
MTEDTRGRSFDALAKGLASGDVSRGKALKLVGAALLSIPTVAGVLRGQSSRSGLHLLYLKVGAVP